MQVKLVGFTFHPIRGVPQLRECTINTILRYDRHDYPRGMHRIKGIVKYMPLNKYIFGHGMLNNTVATTSWLRLISILPFAKACS